LERRLAAILAADVVGYTALMENDETGTLAALKKHRAELFDPEIANQGGRVVKLIGDGVLVEFNSVVDAVKSALNIQRNLVNSIDSIQLRIGINLGDVIIDGEDIYGEGVNVAARLESLAEPGSICISGAAYDIVRGKVSCEFEDCGPQSLKNMANPVRVFRVLLGTEGVGQSHASSQEESERQSIAVLPFSNMSGDAEQEYFSDGITEDIITDLSKVSRLFVIARNSSFSYKGRAVKIQQISSDLGAKYIVEGSVRKSGNRVRVTAQLIEGSTGGHIWAERYDRDLTDVFEVQDDITQNIVGALKIALAPKERLAIERVPTRNLQAYDGYLRGRQLLHEMTRENFENARKLFAEAVELDPEYAIALTGLADCDASIYHYYSSDLSFVESAISYSQKALKLDPFLAEAHSSMGYALWLKGENADAEQEFHNALELDPMLYEAFWNFGNLALDKGDFELAADLYSKASKVRGDDLQSKIMLMMSLVELDQEKKIATVAKETFEIAARQLESNAPDARAVYIGATALLRLNEDARASRWLKKAEKIGSTDPRSTYNIACVYSMLGDFEKALEFLKQSIEAGRPIRMLKWATEDPDLALLRQDPRFGQLMDFWRGRSTDDSHSD
jgi:adenylate cyclase